MSARRGSSTYVKRAKAGAHASPWTPDLVETTFGAVVMVVEPESVMRRRLKITKDGEPIKREVDDDEEVDVDSDSGYLPAPEQGVWLRIPVTPAAYIPWSLGAYTIEELEMVKSLVDKAFDRARITAKTRDDHAAANPSAERNYRRDPRRMVFDPSTRAFRRVE